MTLRVIPGRSGVEAVALMGILALIALILGVPVTRVSWVAGPVLLALMGLAAADYLATRHAWRASLPAMTRRLPAAFAIGARRQVPFQVDATGAGEWQCGLHDHVDPTFETMGLPASVTVIGGKRVESAYTVVPTQRGDVTFRPADVRIRSRLGLCELVEQLGPVEHRRVYPDFGQVARYAWLAGDRRLQEIGIKTYQQRGSGTDFKQLSEYRVGDSVRHIDWRATQRMGKPIVREFQDERDQYVMLLVDCGRRMRADDRQGRIGTTHFDQVLNAVMLLSYVALKQGDAVGAMTFGTPPGQERSVTPRKGAQSLNTLMAQLFDVQPTPTHSDYLAAAQDLLRRQRKRALVIVITNFRDEDSAELHQALRLLRSRHLVLLASLRERIVGELIAQPLTTGDATIEVAGAHLYEQSRRDAFNRLAARDALMVDAEPERLGIELVNRYHAVKRSGLV
jgi:uncharacterized protein (DUF58 family)